MNSDLISKSNIFGANKTQLCFFEIFKMMSVNVIEAIASVLQLYKNDNLSAEELSDRLKEQLVPRAGESNSGNNHNSGNNNASASEPEDGLINLTVPERAIKFSRNHSPILFDKDGNMISDDVTVYEEESILYIRFSDGRFQTLGSVVDQSVELMNKAFEKDAENEAAILDWVQRSLVTSSWSLTKRFKAKQLLLAELAGFTSRQGPAVSEALRGFPPHNFVKLCRIAVVYSFTQENKFVLDFFGKSDATESSRLWTQQKPRKLTKPWEGCRHPLVKLSYLKFLESAIGSDNQWTLTKVELQAAADYGWDIVTMKTSPDEDTLKLKAEGMETFKENFKKSFKNWMSQSSKGGGIACKKNLKRKFQESTQTDEESDEAS